MQSAKSYDVRPIMDEPGDDGLVVPLETVIKHHVLTAIEICGGNKTLAAERLGVTRFWIYRRLREWRRMCR